MDSDDVPSGGAALPEATPAPPTTSHPSTASASASASVSASAAAAGVTVAVNPPTTSAVVSGMASTTEAAASAGPSAVPLSRYESQKRRDWNTFLEYLRNHKPPLALGRCSGAHVIEFLKYLDQFGKTKVHVVGCDFFGQPAPPASCACPLRQAWGSLDALIGRLRAAYEENGGRPESNPFGARAVRIYLREVRESQAKARGIPYEKKKRKRHPPPPPPPDATDTAAETSSSSLAPATAAAGSSRGGGGEEDAAPAPAAEGTSS